MQSLLLFALSAAALSKDRGFSHLFTCQNKRTTPSHYHGQESDVAKLFGALRDCEGRGIVDRLREIGLDQYVELPQIAVMGDTSSGKSSLLSALSGVAFPSSDRLTTRCPTQLLLSRAPVFPGRVRLHRFQSNHSEPEEPIASIDDVADAIERLTEQLVAEGQSISDDAIVIELSGPSLPNLALTDLPGLVRTVGDGEDQSMIPRVREMVLRYMKQSRTIIIAVVPANVDWHNTEILQAAQEADPQGVRTIGVVTKVDLVDKGAERAVHELLLNRTKRMNLGYHAVTCRSQKDHNDGMAIDAGRRQERAFFTTHEYWGSTLERTSWGVDSLTDKLVAILQDNIRRTLPSVVREIRELMAQAESELHAMGPPFDSASERRRAFGDTVDRFVRPLEALLKGDYASVRSSTVIDGRGVDVRLRAQIRRCDKEFVDKIYACKDAMPGLHDGAAATVQRGDLVVIPVDGEPQTVVVDQVDDQGDVQCLALSDEWLGRSRYKLHGLNALRRFMDRNRGSELPIFASHSVFCSIVQQWIDTWEAPTMELLDAYRSLTLRVASRLVSELHAIPRVHRFIHERAAETLDELCDQAQAELHRVLARERRPFTQDPGLTKQFVRLMRTDVKGLLAQHLPRQGGKANAMDMLGLLADFSHSHHEYGVIAMDCALRAYLQSAARRFVDVVVMLLDDVVLDGLVQRMRRELVGTTDDKLERLLAETDATRARRTELTQKMETLRAATRQIEEL